MSIADLSTGENALYYGETERTSIEPDNADDGLKALLLAHRAIFPTIKKNEAETDIYLEVVTQYQEGEEPQSLYLSAETVQLLSEMGGALDNDVVPLMRNERGNQKKH